MPTIPALAKNDRVNNALRHFHETLPALESLIINVQQIPAPTFNEKERAAFIHQQFKTLGLADVETDPLGNVYARLAGKNTTLRPLVVSAHSDTVFPRHTDLNVHQDGHLIHGPGIADNSAGVAGLLYLAQTIERFSLETERDIWFVSNVCEEGLGDLRGMRAVADRFQDAAGFIVIEGGMYGYVLHEGIGVRRFNVTVQCEGGHSWSDFGRTSAIHVIGHIIGQIDGLRAPKSPKTTFNVGVVGGGTSINTIAAKAEFQLDLRSEDPTNLEHLITQFNTIIRKSRRRFDAADIAVTQIGNRPAGGVPRSEWLVQLADEALKTVGCKKIQYLRGSTDANIPLSKGMPAVCIGLARSANAHRLDEYLDTTELPQGMQQLLLLTLAAGSAKIS